MIYRLLMEVYVLSLPLCGLFDWWLYSLLTDPNSFSCALVRISLYRTSASLNFPCFR